tara:strand:+ start:215 stop:1267 length:1053 start_codon:yes stop_codon:yes gene_type:complete
MAYEIGTDTVITDGRALDNIAGTDFVNRYDDLSPSVKMMSSGDNIDFENPVSYYFMTGNAAMAFDNLSDGATCVLLLDTRPAPHFPSFTSGGGTLFWSTSDGATPTWGDYRYWQLIFTVSGSTIRATAGGFTFTGTSAPPQPTEDLQPSFSLPSQFSGRFIQSVQADNIPLDQSTCNLSIGFVHEPDDNRIAVVCRGSKDSDPAGGNFNETVYINYSGFNNITAINVRYNIINQGTNQGSSTTWAYHAANNPNTPFAANTNHSIIANSMLLKWLATGLTGNPGTATQEVDSYSYVNFQATNGLVVTIQNDGVTYTSTCNDLGNDPAGTGINNWETSHIYQAAGGGAFVLV